MNIKKLIKITIFASCLAFYAHTENLNDGTQQAVAQEKSVIKLTQLTQELHAARKLLAEIKNNQNPNIINRFASMLTSITKEITYLCATGACAYCLTPMLARSIYDVDLIHQRSNQYYGEMITCGFLAAITSYIILKITFESILKKPNNSNQIQEALPFIEKTIAMLDYEIEKTEQITNVKTI